VRSLFYVIFAALAAATAVQSGWVRVSDSPPPSGCNIKGNISIDTHERIYHVPGQRYYDDTVIDPRYGERWFCSEAEARAAGWRKSKV
jgi:hypothetical protein